MTARAATTGILLLLLLAVLAIGLFMLSAGSPARQWIGLFLGLGLGGLNLFVESLSLTWALRKRPSATMFVSLGGFGVRLVLVSVLTIVFAKSRTVSAVAFALAYVASFLAFLVLQVWAVTKIQNKAGGGTR